MMLSEINLIDELFTHVGDDGTTRTTYDVTKLFDYVLAHESEVEKISVPVDEEHARYCFEHRGAEEERIAVLMEHPEYLRKPVLFIALPNGEHLLADGTHRYIVFFMMKAPVIPAYIVPWSMAEPFIIVDMPEESKDLLLEYSGIAELRKLLAELDK